MPVRLAVLPQYLLPKGLITRSVGRLAAAERGDSAYFLSANRNK